MALNLQNPFSIFLFASLISSLLVKNSLSLRPKFYEITNFEDGFASAIGTWYGDSSGAGSGGACGWANDVESPPFSAMIAAGNANIFLQGKGCGNCYEVKCVQEPHCSGNPITVTITDECPGECNNFPYHFDLSGTAFGALAHEGQANDLRNLGRIDIEYRRVPCNYGDTKIAFKIDANTNPYWFAAAIEYNNGDGGLQWVDIAPAGTDHFVPMANTWGAVWTANIDPSYQGPFSFKLTSPRNNEAIIANYAVPFGFVPGQTYYSDVNFWP